MTRLVLFSLLAVSLLLSGCKGAPIEFTAIPESPQPTFPADTSTAESSPEPSEPSFPAATLGLLQASATSAGTAYPPAQPSATSAATPYAPPAATATSAPTSAGTAYVPPAATATSGATRTLTPTGAATQIQFTPSPSPTTLPGGPGVTVTLEVSVTATEFIGQPIGSPQPAASVVSIWHGLTGDQRTALDRIIDSFQNSYPEVTFDVTYVPKDELRKRYEAASYNGKGPNLLLAPTEWGWAYAQSGLIADVKPYASPEFLGTISPAALGSVLLGEQLMGLPYSQQGYVLYRNTAIVPQASATFDELLANAQNAIGVGNVGAYLEREALVSSAIIPALGGRLMDAQGRPAFNSDAGLAWLGLLGRYSEAGVAGTHTNRDRDLFEQGKIGVIIEGTWRMRSLANAIGSDNLAIDAWPITAGGRMSGYVQTEAVFLNTNTAEKDKLASLRFMGYLLDRNVQGLLGESGMIPTVMQAGPRDMHVQQAMTALLYGIAWPVADEAVLQVYWNALDQAINDVFERGVSPTAALQSAYDVVNVRLDELGGE
jgi:arabinogalactan oligomer/maltooligosaccharide transport system substrate-binding protein